MRCTNREELAKREIVNSKVVDSNKHITYRWSEEGTGHYTKQEDMYMKFLKKMLPQFKGGSILEVGPGTGEFAKRMFDKYSVTEYNILDVEGNINDSKDFLNGLGLKANYIISQNYEKLFGSDMDLFVSNVCLPEIPEYYSKNLVKSMFPTCEYAFVIGGNEFSDYNNWIKSLFDMFFKIVQVEETGYCGTFAISGEGRKK